MEEIDLPVVYMCQRIMPTRCPRFDTPRQFVRRWWLIAPAKDDPGRLIIRCPEHYTDDALRLTIYGRLTTLREHAAEARPLELEPGDGLLRPPIRFLGAERGDLQDDVPD